MSERVKKKRKRGMSLRAKIVTAFVVMALVIAATSVGVSYINYQNAMNRNYETMADNVASTAESQLNAQDNVSFYLSLDTLEETYAQLTPTDHSASEYIESQSSYISIVAALSEIVDANDNVVRSLYLIVPSTDGEGFYYLFDTAPEGSARYYAEYETFAGSTFADFAAEMRAGEEIEPVIGEALGSWLMNICHHAELADTSYYLCVSLSMDVVQQDQISFFVTMVAVVLLIVVLFVIIYLILFNAILVTPIKRMTKAAADFIDEGSTSEESSIAVLDIHTGDELQNLSESLKKMEGDINNYINNLYYYTAEQERLGTELSIARQIQADMLPSIFPAFPEHEEFDIYASMNPAKEVGGDFYDFFMVDERHLAIVVADVSGKGVPAALFMVIAKTLIKDHTQQMKTELGEVFTKVNTLLCDSNNEGMFVTAFEGVLDLETGLLTYVNAGHELPFVMGKDGKFKPIKIRAGFVLAGMDGLRYRAGTMQLEEGDKLFQYTDGVTEATNEEKELYGMGRLEAVLNANADKPVHDILHAVKRDIDDFVGEAEQFDDITMLGLEFKRRQHKSEETDVKSITLDAITENLATVTDFINDELGRHDCSPKTLMQLDIAIDEIFGNIASYAYAPGTGKVTVQIRVDDKARAVRITFIDGGVPYNPLAKEDPNVKLSAEERKIGGLGIFLVKKSMDDMLYEYKDGKNRLTLVKKF